METRKIDQWKERKDLFSPSWKEVSEVTVPPFPYAMIDGAGDPNTSPAFRDSIGILYGISYTLKFMLKKERGLDYKVMPLCGLYSADDVTAFSEQRKGEWRWTLMIQQPPEATTALFARAAEELARKKRGGPLLDAARLEVLEEGLSAQILHRGPYAEERPTIEKLHAYIAEKGYRFAGRHNEIYVSDPGRTAPERMKTILRQPVRTAGRG